MAASRYRGRLQSLSVAEQAQVETLTPLNPLLSVEVPFDLLLSTLTSSGSFLRRKLRRMIMTIIIQRMMKPTMPTMR